MSPKEDVIAMGIGMGLSASAARVAVRAAGGRR
jgi:hypothetical protein